MNWLKKLLNIDDLKEEIKEAAIVNHDEVMLLTLETERLDRELIVSKNAKNEADAKTIKLDKALTDCETKYMQVAEENIKLKRNSNVSDVKRYKQYCREKDAKIESLSVLYENNKNLREAYEFIANDENREVTREAISTRLSVYMKEKDLSYADATRIFKVDRNAVRELRKGIRTMSVNNLQNFYEILCEHFDCDVLELVKKKVSE